MRRVPLNIEQRDIDAFRRDRQDGASLAHCCPIAQSLKRVGVRNPIVGCDVLSPGSGFWVRLAVDAKGFVTQHNLVDCAKPCTVHILVPEAP